MAAFQQRRKIIDSSGSRRRKSRGSVLLFVSLSLNVSLILYGWTHMSAHVLGHYDMAPSSEVSDDVVSRSVLWENARRKIAERANWLSDDHSEGAAFQTEAVKKQWTLFGPVLSCPFSDFEKEPSSIVEHDGGKWLCGLQQVARERRMSHDPCIVYSFGSENSFHFEKRVKEVAPACEVHVFDPTVAETGDGKAYYSAYHGDYGLGARDGASGTNLSKNSTFVVKSLPTIAKELRHDHIDIVKIDVEGYEWEVLEADGLQNVKIGQLLIELHTQKPIDRYSTEDRRKGGMTVQQMHEMYWTRLERLGFVCISLEPVTKMNTAQMEAVFLHRDWLPHKRWW